VFKQWFLIQIDDLTGIEKHLRRTMSNLYSIFELPVHLEKTRFFYEFAFRADWKCSKRGSDMENQKLSVHFLSILKDAELVLCPEIIVWNLLSKSSYRKIDFDFKYTRKNTSRNAHFKSLRPFQSGAILALIF
jgi:hypothetical protein